MSTHRAPRTREGSSHTETVAVCECSACGYESPSVKAGPDIGCGACPECGEVERMDRTTQEAHR